MATIAFDVESMICGYHEYMHFLESSSAGESLVCEAEIGNSHYIHAIAIKKDTDCKIKTVRQNNYSAHYLKQINVHNCFGFVRGIGRGVSGVSGNPF